MATFLGSYADRASFAPGRFTPVPIGGNDRVRALLTCFEPGQTIPVHAPSVDMTFAVLEGEGTLVADDGEHPIAPGAVAFIPAGESRGVRARTRLVALHVVTPPPTAEDHRAVMKGLGE